MSVVTFLGPQGTTFSGKAYAALASHFNAPRIGSTDVQYIQAPSNSEILDIVAQHNGYGAVAMETQAEGRVVEPLESFIDLVPRYATTEECPFRILGAVRLRLHFCLMARPGIFPGNITAIIAHPKALGACAQKIAHLGTRTINADSNGEAARCVATQKEYATCAAIGPASAAKKYGLSILYLSFGDQKALTTFFLVGPKTHPISLGKKNRMLIVYKVAHKPGALVESLLPFNKLNLIQIHSLHTGNHTYNFGIEIEVEEDEQDTAQQALKKFAQHAEKYLSFGPFPVLS